MVVEWMLTLDKSKQILIIFSDNWLLVYDCCLSCVCCESSYFVFCCLCVYTSSYVPKQSLFKTYRRYCSRVTFVISPFQNSSYKSHLEQVLTWYRLKTSTYTNIFLITRPYDNFCTWNNLIHVLVIPHLLFSNFLRF